MSAAKYANLAQVPAGEARLKALFQAISLDLALPQIALDMQGGKALHAPQLFDAEGKSKARPITFDATKAFLSTKYAVPGDNPNLESTTSRVVQYFHTGLNEMDLGWTQLFRFIDMRQSDLPSFNIVGASSGLTFKQRAPGEKVEINRTFGDTKATVEFVTYAGGLGVLDDWLRFQQYWNIQQIVEEFRGKYYDKQAEIHYGLFTAIGSGINIAFDTDATKTFNKAVAGMLRALNGKGMGVSSGAQVDILVNPEQVGYVLKMLEATRGSQMVAYNAASQPLAYSVRNVISTTQIPANATGYYVVLADRKIQRATWMDLQIESNRDIYKRAVDWVGTAQFNAAIGDTDQVRRVAFS